MVSQMAINEWVMATIASDGGPLVIFHCRKNGKEFTMHEVPHLAERVRIECRFNKIEILREENR